MDVGEVGYGGVDVASFLVRRDHGELGGAHDAQGPHHEAGPLGCSVCVVRDSLVAPMVSACSSEKSVQRVCGREPL